MIPYHIPLFADCYCPWFPNNPIPYYNLKGFVSREREPKQAYYVLQEFYRERRERGSGIGD